MSDDPRFWDPSLRSDPAQATEVNQLMYTQTQLPGQLYGGYQLGTGGTLGAQYGQNPEHPSLRHPGAPTPTQGFLAPAYYYPMSTYPSSTHSTQASSMLPASGVHQRHALVGALNYTGNFGADNVGASNLHHGHAGHFLPPTSTHFSGHGVVANPAPLQTSRHTVMHPSPTPTPPMTAGTSRSSSYMPGTPGSSNAGHELTLEDITMVLDIILPQLTAKQVGDYWYRSSQNRAPSLAELYAMVDANNASMSSAPAPDILPAGIAPPMQSIPAYDPSTSEASRSHANGPNGAQRRPKTRQPRYDPISTTTYQAAATSADLGPNNYISTGAALMGGAHSSGAGGVAASSSRSTEAAAGPSTDVYPEHADEPISNPSSPRAHDPKWYKEATEAGFSTEKRAALDTMFREQNNTFCIFPGCKEAGRDLASAQSRNRHVHAQHVRSLRVLCVLCGHTYARADALQVHQQTEDRCRRLTNQRRKLEKKGKGKAREEPAVEDDGVVAPGPGFRKEGDDDDADLGGVGGMVAGTYGTVWA